MRKALYLMVGFLVAIFLGRAYLHWTGNAPEVPAPAAATPLGSGAADTGLMLAAVAFCWITAFVRLPGWLSVVLGFAIVWIGLAVMAVTGFFVYLQYPNNTLDDGMYAGFLCSIAMVASRGGSVLKYMHREGGA
jgi:hypothetical protein